MRAVPSVRAAAVAAATLLLAAACAAGPSTGASAPGHAVDADAEGTLARIYYWKSKPGKFEEYTRYVREHAEPIDAEARRLGAFVSVTTFMTEDPASPWTHMRVFVLRDTAQLEGLSAALSAAGVRLEPDSVKRRQASQYSATLRDAAGSATVDILR